MIKHRSLEKHVKGLNKTLARQIEQTKKMRVQQPGDEGHGRRDYSHLPAAEKTLGLSEKYSHCSCCGLRHEELSRYEASEILEAIHGQAHRRIINRKRYKRNCTCKKNFDPQILLAPSVERILPKSKLGVSIWAMLLIHKVAH